MNEGKAVLVASMFLFGMVLLWVIRDANKGHRAFGVNLSFQKLVSEPVVDYKQVYWLDLRGVHLEGANLDSTVLKRADHQGGHLRAARMFNAVLEGANLQGANLVEAEGLTLGQLSEAKTLHGAKLNPELMEQIRKNRPRLLGKPKPDE